MTEPYDFKMNSGGGTAEPLFAQLDLFPAALDSALGALKAREAYEAACETGRAAQLAYVAASNLWAASHPRGDFPDGASWDKALDVATRDEAAAVSICTRASVASLTTYRDSQQAGARGAKPRFVEAWLDADQKALDAFATLTAAIEAREELTRYIVVPEKSAAVGRGHWMNSSMLIGRLNPTAQHQFDEMEIVVMVAPRQQIKALAAKAATR